MLPFLPGSSHPSSSTTGQTHLMAGRGETLLSIGRHAHNSWARPNPGSTPMEEDYQMTVAYGSMNLHVTPLQSPFPRDVLNRKPEKPLPVMVYVHGGGFEDGVAHVDGLHETTKLVAFSAECGMPVIAVNIGYRLNWFGFMKCSDIIEEIRESNADEGRSQELLNLGLYDQRKAFQWIQAQIGGFGGDASDITAFGESAGSIALVYHLCSEEPLFRRAILQSGGSFGNTSLAERDMI
jgi:acetyl esterase/lipase